MNDLPAIYQLIDTVSDIAAESDSPELHALAVALAAIEGWGDFTADDLEEFIRLEIVRQKRMDEGEDGI